MSLQWRHNGRDSVSNHKPNDCLLNRLFRRRSKKTSKFRVTGLCARNSPGTGEFPAQMASYAENVSIWWRHHVKWLFKYCRCMHNHRFFYMNHAHLWFEWDLCSAKRRWWCHVDMVPMTHDDVLTLKRFPHYWSFVRWSTGLLTKGLCVCPVVTAPIQRQCYYLMVNLYSSQLLGDYAYHPLLLYICTYSI